MSLPPIAMLVRSLAPDRPQPVCLLAQDADPHHAHLRPSQREALEQARLVVRAGIDDRGWSWPAGEKQALILWPGRHHGWLAPDALEQAAEHLAQALTEKGLTDGEDAGARLRAFRETLAEELARWRRLIAPLAGHGVILEHPAFAPWFAALGVPVRMVLESGHHAEPSPRLLERALAMLRNEPGVWLIGNLGHGNRALDWLMRHASRPVPRVDLDPLGRCDMDWASWMRENRQRLARAIGGRTEPR